MGGSACASDSPADVGGKGPKVTDPVVDPFEDPVVDQAVFGDT